MAIEIKEEWLPMPPQMGPPLPQSMQVYWPWVKRPPEEEIEEEISVPAPPIPTPPLAPPTPKYRLYAYTVGKGTVTPADGSYPAGTMVTLTARPGYGAAFDRWAGDAAGTSPMVNITMDRSKSATAYFKAITPPPYEEEPPPEELLPVPPEEVAPPPEVPKVAGFYMPAQLQVRVAGPYNGLYKVTFSTRITNRGDSTGRYELAWGSNYLAPGYEEEVSRIITLAPGASYDWSFTYDEVFDYYSGYFTCWLFGEWEGNNSSVGTFTVREVAAPPPPAPPKEYGLTTTVSPSGAGTVTGAGTYTAGTYATCDATPASGYEFDHWGGDATGTSPSLRILMDRVKRVIAYFKKEAVPAYKLSILVQPMAAGWVTKEPNKATYNYGETVKLTARTAPDYRFSSWTVDGEWAGYSTTLTLMVTKDLEVRASFTQ